MPRAYVTVTGIADWPVVNGLWASILHRGYLPDRLYLLSALGGGERERRLVGWLEAVLGGHGSTAQVEVVPLSGDAFAPTLRAIREVVARERAVGSEVAVDITAGRKAVVAGLLVAGCSIAFDHVFYLHIDHLRYAAHPYLMIPLCIQQHRDLVEEAGGAG